MVNRSLRDVQSLIGSLGLFALAVQVFACSPAAGPVDAAARLGIDPAGVVDIGTAAVAASAGAGGTVSILAIHQRDGDWVMSPLSSSQGPAGADSLHLITYSGATGEEWNSFAFGTAAPGTVRVELAGFPDQRGGTVVNGAWVIALREKDVQPHDIEWRFIDGDGSVRTGVGVFPPDA